jgi:PAS domain S-box-containing protein
MTKPLSAIECGINMACRSFLGSQTDLLFQSEMPPTSEELLQLIIDSAKDYGIFTIDPNGITTSWNRGAERLLGYREDEILGQSADVIFTPEDRAAGKAEEERRLAASTSRAEDDRWHMRRDGTRFWASGVLTPLAEPAMGFLKILRDRTKEHNAEEQLRESEARFRLLATNIPQLVFRSRSTGSRTWPSPQWCVFTGQSFQQSVGFGWLDAIHPEDRDATLEEWDRARTGGAYYIEHRVRAADGEYRWHQTRARPLEGLDSADWVGTMTDIHDLRDLHERQKVLLTELQHRTRNLLAVVQSIARETLRTSESLDAFGADFESRLRSLGRVQNMIARSGDEGIDLRGLITAELAAFQSTKSDAKIRIGGPEVSLPGSAAQTFALAIHELATNAVKHGALRQPSSELIINWALLDDPVQPCVRLEWQETGMHITEPPKREGYGSVLIKRALPYQLKAKTNLTFRKDGVHCSISLPLPKAK